MQHTKDKDEKQKTKQPPAPLSKVVRKKRMSDDGSLPPETPGYKLLWLVNQQVSSQSISLAQLADLTGISVSTISQLQRGMRTTTSLGSKSIRGLSTWLELPVLAVMMLAEQITPEDFYTEKQINQISIERAIAFILGDPDWGTYAPKSLLDSDNRETQLFVIWCYEEATGTKLLSSNIDYHSLIGSMTQFREEVPLEK